MTGGRRDIRPITADDRSRVSELLAREWGSTQMVSRGEVHDLLHCPGLLCVEQARVVGLTTYAMSPGECQVLTLNAIEKGRGIGSHLLDGVTDRAKSAGCRRLWLLTSNDNLDAMRFYQRRGLRLVAVYPGAIDEERHKFKPQIPLIGSYGIPIRDEVEFELEL